MLNLILTLRGSGCGCSKPDVAEPLEFEQDEEEAEEEPEKEPEEDLGAKIKPLKIKPAPRPPTPEPPSEFPTVLQLGTFSKFTNRTCDAVARSKYRLACISNTDLFVVDVKPKRPKQEQQQQQQQNSHNHNNNNNKEKEKEEEEKEKDDERGKILFHKKFAPKMQHFGSSSKTQEDDDDERQLQTSLRFTPNNKFLTFFDPDRKSLVFLSLPSYDEVEEMTLSSQDLGFSSSSSPSSKSSSSSSSSSSSCFFTFCERRAELLTAVADENSSNVLKCWRWQQREQLREENNNKEKKQEEQDKKKQLKFSVALKQKIVFADYNNTSELIIVCCVRDRICVLSAETGALLQELNTRSPNPEDDYDDDDNNNNEFSSSSSPTTTTTRTWMKKRKETFENVSFVNLFGIFVLVANSSKKLLFVDASYSASSAALRASSNNSENGTGGANVQFSVIRELSLKYHTPAALAVAPDRNSLLVASDESPIRISLFALHPTGGEDQVTMMTPHAELSLQHAPWTQQGAPISIAFESDSCYFSVAIRNPTGVGECVLSFKNPLALRFLMSASSKK